MKLSLIIPMYNEAAILPQTVRTLTEYLAAQPFDWELVFVDDGSTDGSAALVEGLGLPGVRVLGYTPNRGKGRAVKTGMLEGRGELLMFLDADLAYGTQVIARVVEAMDQAPDKQVLLGSRVLHPEGYAGYTPLRRLASKTYILVLRLVGGFRLSDSQCGCKAFRRQAAREIFSRVQTDGFAFDFEAILWAQKLGYAIQELPVKIVNHRASKVNTLRDTFRMLAQLRQIRRRVGRGEEGSRGA